MPKRLPNGEPFGKKRFAIDSLITATCCDLFVSCGPNPRPARNCNPIALKKSGPTMLFRTVRLSPWAKPGS